MSRRWSLCSGRVGRCYEPFKAAARRADRGQDPLPRWRALRCRSLPRQCQARGWPMDIRDRCPAVDSRAVEQDYCRVWDVQEPGRNALREQ